MLIVTCHILTVSLKVLDMTSLNDTPLLSLLQSEFDTEPQNLWMLTDSERKEVLTEKIVDRFISFHTQMFTSVQMMYMSIASNWLFLHGVLRCHP